MNRLTLVFVLTAWLATADLAVAVDYPGAPPAARACCSATDATLENDVIADALDFRGRAFET